MTHKFYLSSLMKGMMIFMLVVMALLLLVVLFLLFIAEVFHLPIVSALLIMAVAIGIPVAAVIWRLGTPAVEISESGFKAVKFKRSDVINLLPNGASVQVHVTGKVGAMTFEGVDTIRVMK